jgi:Fanconi-associated nuclease 1
LVGDRFKAGHVLTRIVYKSAQALGILHEYEAECMVLRKLLEQRRWRRSKRGAWYERLALVLMNHFSRTPGEKEEGQRAATQVCIDGLLDEDTHLSECGGGVGAVEGAEDGANAQSTGRRCRVG